MVVLRAAGESPHESTIAAAFFILAKDAKVAFAWVADATDQTIYGLRDQGFKD